MSGCNNWGALIGVPLVLFFLVFVSGCGNDNDATGNKVAKGKKTIRIADRKPAKEQLQTNVVNKARSFRLSTRLLRILLTKAADMENSRAILNISEKYRRNPDPKARMECVEVLFELHEKGIIALTTFIHDSDKAVADRAIQLVETQLDLVSDNYLKASMLGSIILSLTNEDDLRSFTAKLSLLPPEYAVKKIADIAKHKDANPLAYDFAAKEYETITGEPFKSVAEANRWVRIHCQR
jgi:hypothetical protein